MSLYEPSPSYYRDTVPYTSSDIGEPVPGWGTTVRIAGPPRVGMGAATIGRWQMSPIMTMSMARPVKDAAQDASTMRRTVATDTADAGAGQEEEDDTTEEEESEPLPWWIFPTIAMVALGGVGWYGTKKGWF